MTQNTMIQTPETELKADLSKTVEFLRKKWDSVCEATAPEIIGKSEDEIGKILDRVKTDFWNMGVEYFIRERSKTLRKLLKI